jgi:hypothetical protein
MNRHLVSGVAALLFAAPQLAAADWVPAWSASPQPVWESNFLFPTDVPPSLEDRTIRQIVRIGFGGNRVRIRFSNDYGRQAVRIDAVHIARSAGGSSIHADSDRPLTFAGLRQAVLLPGSSLLSDPVDMSVKPRTWRSLFISPRHHRWKHSIGKGASTPPSHAASTSLIRI